MSLVSGAVSGSRDMDNNNKNNEENGNTSKTASDDEGVGSVGRQMSESSLCVTEEEEEDDSKLHLGPQYTIKEHLEKDKVASFFQTIYFFPNYIFFEEFS